MIIYNTTFNVEEQTLPDWIAWIKGEYLPLHYDTGLFVKHIFSRVLVEEEMGGATYSLQLFSPSMVMLKTYEDNHHARIESELVSRFKGKYVSFKTLLEVEPDIE